MPDGTNPSPVTTRRRLAAIRRAVGDAPWTAADAARVLGVSRRGAHKLIERARALDLVVWTDECPRRYLYVEEDPA